MNPQGDKLPVGMVAACCLPFKALTLFTPMTKIYDLPYPIFDQTKNLIPYS